MSWVWLDPVVSLLIAAVVLIGNWSLFRQSLHMLCDGVPDSIDPQAVRDCLAALPGVSWVHDLHIWSMGTSPWPRNYPGQTTSFRTQGGGFAPVIVVPPMEADSG